MVCNAEVDAAIMIQKTVQALETSLLGAVVGIILKEDLATIEVAVVVLVWFLAIVVAALGIEVITFMQALNIDIAPKIVHVVLVINCDIVLVIILVKVFIVIVIKDPMVTNP